MGRRGSLGREPLPDPQRLPDLELRELIIAARAEQVARYRRAYLHRRAVQVDPLLVAEAMLRRALSGR